MSDKKSAFSLFELAVALLIIGVLVSGSVIGAKKLINSSRLASARALTASSPVPALSGLILWLESTSSTAFPTGQNINGASVSTWYDLTPTTSYKNNVATGTAPTFTDNAINGLPALSFNGSTSRLIGTFNEDFSGIEGKTIFVVFKLAATGTDQMAAAVGSASSGAGFGVGCNSTVFNGVHWSRQNSLASTVNTNPVIVSASLSTSGAVLAYANSLTATSSSGTPAAPSLSNNITIGAIGTSNYFNGFIGEVIIYNRALAKSEMREVENYLSKKWKITVG